MLRTAGNAPGHKTVVVAGGFVIAVGAVAIVAIAFPLVCFVFFLFIRKASIFSSCQKYVVCACNLSDPTQSLPKPQKAYAELPWLEMNNVLGILFVISPAFN